MARDSADAGDMLHDARQEIEAELGRDDEADVYDLLLPSNADIEGSPSEKCKRFANWVLNKILRSYAIIFDTSREKGALSLSKFEELCSEVDMSGGHEVVDNYESVLV